MSETPVTFFSEHEQIVGMLHSPGALTDKMIIMCHGFTGNKLENKRLFVEAARSFTKQGYAALRFDFYGSGDSAGEFADSTISHNRANLLDAIQFARLHNYTKLIVLGISMGAATAVISLVNQPVAALILWSAVPDFRQLFQSYFFDYEDKISSLEEFEYDGWLIRKAFWQNSLLFDIQENFKQLGMPKLIIQGTADAPLFVDGFKLFQRNARPPADFYEIPGAGHTFQTVKHRHEVIRATLTWLKRHI